MYKTNRGAFLLGLFSAILGIVFFAIFYYFIFNDSPFRRAFDYTLPVGSSIIIPSMTTLGALFRGEKWLILASSFMALFGAIYLIYATNNILQWYIIVPLMYLITFISLLNIKNR